MRDSPRKRQIAITAERSRVATEGWASQLLARQSPAGNWGGPKEDRGLLATPYRLIVLTDLGFDPASKPARRMVDRVDKRIVFKPRNNRLSFTVKRSPASTGESSLSARTSTNRITRWRIDCYASHSKMEAGTAKRLNFRQTARKAGVLHSIPPSACSRTCLHTNRHEADPLPSPGPAREARTICSIGECSVRCEPARSSTNGGSASRSRRVGTTTSCAGLILWGTLVLNPTAASVRASKPRDQAPPPEQALAARPTSCQRIPLQMETDLGRASRWSTLRPLRVLRWYNNSTC